MTAKKDSPEEPALPATGGARRAQHVIGRARAFGQLDRLVLSMLLRLFSATLGGVVLIYLVIDFADRAHGYRGRAWGLAVLELYANKAAVVGYQLAPAALIIAAALLVTLLARRGELTAMFALGVSPARIAAPVAAFAAVLGAAMFLLGEKVVVRADARVEEITVKRFNRWGDWATYHVGSFWVRGHDGRIFHIGGQSGDGFDLVTVLEIGDPNGAVRDFRLSRRILAARMEPLPGGRWKLLDATETRYSLTAQPGGDITERHAAELVEDFPETPRDFELRGGRPRQLPWRQLREQTRRREAAGQPSREYSLAIAERAAQPVQAVPAALAAFALSLSAARRRKRMPLAGAVALGIALSLALWAVSVVAHAVSLSGALAPWIAGALPGVVSLLAIVLGFAL
jgi:lipopolysaccharide export system permease protein